MKYSEKYPVDPNLTEISMSELQHLVDTIPDTPNFERVITMARQFQEAGMTPRILWDMESSNLRIRCDETAGRLLS